MSPRRACSRQRLSSATSSAGRSTRRREALVLSSENRPAVYCWRTWIGSPSSRYRPTQPEQLAFPKAGQHRGEDNHAPAGVSRLEKFLDLGRGQDVGLDEIVATARTAAELGAFGVFASSHSSRMA